MDAFSAFVILVGFPAYGSWCFWLGIRAGRRDAAKGLDAVTLAALRLFLSGVPRWVWALFACAFLVLGYGHWRYNAGQAEVQHKFDAFRADLAERTAKANAAARATEQKQRDDLAAIAANYEKEKADAIAKERRVADAVRAGALRLRKQWTCPAARPAEAAADPAGADEAADLRAADSGVLFESAPTPTPR